MIDSSNHELLSRVVERLRAIADESRVRLLTHLHSGPANVSTLTAALKMNQASVSKHLAVLRQAGLVAVQRVGTQAVYRIADESVIELCDQVCSGVMAHIKKQRQSLAAALPEGKTTRKNT